MKIGCGVMRVRNWIGRLLAGGLALAVTALAGCASLPLDMRDAGEAVALPTPDVSIAPAPTGDSRQADLLRVNLYYPTADGAQLTEVPRFFRLSGDETLAHRAVRALLADPPADGLARVAAEGTQLLALEQSGDVAVVNGIVWIINATQGYSACFVCRGGIHATLEAFDPSGVFSATADTASSTNVYWDGSRYEIQNKTGATRDYAIMMFKTD
mgnify:CR=1 FL=1